MRPLLSTAVYSELSHAPAAHQHPDEQGCGSCSARISLLEAIRYSSVAVFIKGRHLLVAIGGIRNELVPRHRLARLPCGRGTSFAERSVRGWKLSIEVDPEDRVWRQPARLVQGRERTLEPHRPF